MSESAEQSTYVGRIMQATDEESGTLPYPQDLNIIMETSQESFASPCTSQPRGQLRCKQPRLNVEYVPIDFSKDVEEVEARL